MSLGGLLRRLRREPEADPEQEMDESDWWLFTLRPGHLLRCVPVTHHRDEAHWLVLAAQTDAGWSGKPVCRTTRQSRLWEPMPPALADRARVCAACRAHVQSCPACKKRLAIQAGELPPTSLSICQ